MIYLLALPIKKRLRHLLNVQSMVGSHTLPLRLGRTGAIPSARSNKAPMPLQAPYPLGWATCSSIGE